MIQLARTLAIAAALSAGAGPIATAQRPRSGGGVLGVGLVRLQNQVHRLRRRYERRLHRTLNGRPVTLLILAAVVVATGIMYMTTQKELAPEED